MSSAYGISKRLSEASAFFARVCEERGVFAKREHDFEHTQAFLVPAESASEIRGFMEASFHESGISMMCVPRDGALMFVLQEDQFKSPNRKVHRSFSAFPSSIGPTRSFGGGTGEDAPEDDDIQENYYFPSTSMTRLSPVPNCGPYGPGGLSDPVALQSHDAKKDADKKKDSASIEEGLDAYLSKHLDTPNNIHETNALAARAKHLASLSAQSLALLEEILGETSDSKPMIKGLLNSMLTEERVRQDQIAQLLRGI